VTRRVVACIVCRERPRHGCLFCEVCARSYDRALREGDETVATVLEWAARRARRFERNRNCARVARKPRND